MSRYTINNKEYVSSTEITGIPDKSSWLKQWAVDRAVEYIKKNSEYMTEYIPKDFFEVKKEIIEQSRYAHKQVLNATADIGIEAHSLVETFINIQLKGEECRIGLLLKNVNSINLRQMFYQFFVWQKKNVKRWIESEQTVVHEELCFAGTVDFIYEDYNGQIWLVDLKTKNKLYNDEKMQIASYKEARESMRASKYIVYNNRNGKEWETVINNIPIKIDRIGILKIARDFFEPVEITDYTKDCEKQFEAFKGLLTYYYTSAQRRLNNERAINRR